MLDPMDKVTLDIAKFFAGLISTAVTVILWITKRFEKANQKLVDRVAALEDRVIALDKQNAEDRAQMREDTKRLRELVDQNRNDFKERLTDITEYMYKRPR